jgi:tetratricopeptide (TPR) repeat protein
VSDSCKACGAPVSGELPTCDFCGASVSYALSGLGLLRAGKPALDRIFLEYKAKLEENPNDGDAHFGIAAYYAKRELFKEAADHLRKAEKAMPISGEIQYLMAVVYAEWRGWSNMMVKKHGARAKKLAPHMTEAQSLLLIQEGLAIARAAKTRAELPKALTLFEKARGLAVKAHLKHIYFFSGETLERAGRIDDALAMYRASRDFGMKAKAKVYVRIAMILKNQGKMKLALKNLEQAHNIEPGNGAVGRLVASIRVKSG